MPAFIFINGVLFKQFKPRKLIFLMIIFILMQGFYLGYFSFVGYYPAGTNLMERLMIPCFHLWYILAFIFWCIIVFLLELIRKKTRILFCFSLIFLILGALSVRFTVLEGVSDQWMTYTRVFVFLPFFLAGFYLKDYVFKLNVTFSKRMMAIFVLLVAIISVVVLTRVGVLHNTNLFFGFNHINAFSFSGKQFLVLELYQYLVGFALIWSTYVIIPAALNRFTNVSSNVTFIYLLHPVIAVWLIQHYFTDNHLIVKFMLAMLFSLGTVILLSYLNSFIRKIESRYIK